MPPLNMGNLTDDDSEKLLEFTRMVASFQKYGTELKETDLCDFSEDAIQCMNDIIDEARKILKWPEEK